MIRLSSVSLLFALACAPLGQSRNTDDGFFFIQMSDPQFGMFHRDTTFTYETVLFTEAIAQANALMPAFVVITGDLVNQPADTAQIGELLRIAGQLDSAIPLYWVAGNHDVKNSPNDSSLADYRAIFGADWYKFEHEGWQFVVLNSPLIQQPDSAQADYERQQAWIDSLAPWGKGTVVFQHHPYFLKNEGEEDGYFNIPMVRRQAMLDKLVSIKTKAIFAGHHHRNDYARLGKMLMINSGPVGMPLFGGQSGYRVIGLSHGKVRHKYVKLRVDRQQESP